MESQWFFYGKVGFINYNYSVDSFVLKSYYICLDFLKEYSDSFLKKESKFSVQAMKGCKIVV